MVPPERQRSPMMQGPPPSPPLSDADDIDDSSIAVTETSEDVFLTPIEAVPPPNQLEHRSAANLLMPVTKAGESAHALDRAERVSSSGPAGRTGL